MSDPDDTRLDASGLDPTTAAEGWDDEDEEFDDVGEGPDEGAESGDPEFDPEAG